MSEGVIGTSSLDRAFSIQYDEGNKPVVNDAFTSSSSNEEMVPKTSFSIATRNVMESAAFGRECHENCTLIALLFSSLVFEFLKNYS